MPPFLLRCGNAVRAVCALLGFWMILLTAAPPTRYVQFLAGPWNDPRAPVLIVLGGDSVDNGMLGEGSYWRTIYAILAWRDGGFRRIVLSGEGHITYPMRDYLVCQGIPAEAITVEDRSASTRENALFTAEILRGIPGPYVLLTSDYHMWRAHRAFSKAGIAVLPRPFPDAGKRLTTWRGRWPVSMELLAETGKIIYYRARGWI